MQDHLESSRALLDAEWAQLARAREDAEKDARFASEKLVQVRAHNTVLQAQVDSFRSRAAALNKLLEASQREKTDLYADRTFDRVVRGMSSGGDAVVDCDDDGAGVRDVADDGNSDNTSESDPSSFGYHVTLPRVRRLASPDAQQLSGSGPRQRPGAPRPRHSQPWMGSRPSVSLAGGGSFHGTTASSGSYDLETGDYTTPVGSLDEGARMASGFVVDTPAGKVVRMPFVQHQPPRLRHAPMDTLAEMQLESDLERHILNLQEENRRLREGLRGQPEVLQALLQHSVKRGPRLLSADALAFSLDDADGEASAPGSSARRAGASSGVGFVPSMGAAGGAGPSSKGLSLFQSPPSRTAGSGGTQDALRTPLLSDDGCDPWPPRGPHDDGDLEDPEVEFGAGGRQVARFSYRRGVSVDVGTAEAARRRKKVLQRQQQESRSCCAIS